MASRSRSSKLVVVNEEQVAMEDLKVGERYNVTEKIVDLRGKITLITFIGDFSRIAAGISFTNVIYKGEKMNNYGIPISDVVSITKSDVEFPGLPNVLVSKIHNFSKRSPNSYKEITAPTKLSPGDSLRLKNGSNVQIDHGMYVVPGGYHLGRKVHRYKKNKSKGTRKN